MNDTLPSEDRFSIGEIAIVVNQFAIFPPNGSECTILEGPALLGHMRNDGRTEYSLGYYVECTDGKRFAFPHQLRKKRPPREDLQVVRWAECPWQPESVNV